MRKITLVIMGLAGLILICGCALRLPIRTEIDSIANYKIKKVFIETFKTYSLSWNHDNNFYNIFVRKMRKYSKFEIVYNEEEADAIISGTIGSKDYFERKNDPSLNPVDIKELDSAPKETVTTFYIKMINKEDRKIIWNAEFEKHVTNDWLSNIFSPKEEEIAENIVKKLNHEEK